MDLIRSIFRYLFWIVLGFCIDIYKVAGALPQRAISHVSGKNSSKYIRVHIKPAEYGITYVLIFNGIAPLIIHRLDIQGYQSYPTHDTWFGDPIVATE